jgi:hypothetical protein
VPLKTVMFNKPEWTHKMLTGLNQKVSGQVQGLQRSPAADDAPPVERHDPIPEIEKVNEGTSLSSRKGKRTARGADRAAGAG